MRPALSRRQAFALLCMLLPALSAEAKLPNEALIEVAQPEGDVAVRAVFDRPTVAAILASGDYEISSEPVAEDEWGRPWFVLKAGIGLPNLVSASVEIFILREWTIELGTGAGLLPSVFEGSIRWRPDATCWGCDGKNFLSLGFGIDPAVYFNGEGSQNGTVGLMLTASVDIMYIRRFAEHFGFYIGSRIGAGVVTEVPPGDWNGKFEPTLTIHLIQIGFAF
ncbi:MAG: hypothetical protein IT285_03625 [Bdellovibrionales bacterium]|nr:hypothetical protein [Bdellovibrionales bacterium]